MLVPSEPQELDPRVVRDTWGLRVSRLIFGSLLTVSPITLEVEPDLAESFLIESPTRYRVTLRPGLSFSDGSALDAGDVLATYRSILSLPMSRHRGNYERIVRMDKLDARTIVFEIAAPHAPFLTDLTFPILREEDEGSLISVNDGPIASSGAYMLEEYSATFWTLVANPRWHAAPPRYPRIRMVVIRDDNTRALRLLARAGDLVFDAMPPILTPLFDDDARFEVKSAPGLGTTYLGVNLEAICDVRFRQAIAHAIDRQALVTAKYAGRARLARGWITPGHWAFDDTLPDYEFNETKARTLLRQAGVEGHALTIRSTPDRFRVSTARAIAAMLTRVGLPTEVRAVEKDTLFAELEQGRFELVLMTVPEVLDPHVLNWFFGEENIPREGRGGANRWRFSDPEVERALKDAVATPDQTQRRAAYVRIQQILARDLPVIPLWHEDQVAITNARSADFEVPRDGRLQTLAAPAHR